MKKLLIQALMMGLFLSSSASTLVDACSMGGATGSSTVDGRPVLWKNRDAWGSADDWKTFAYKHTADGDVFGSGDLYGDRFNFTGVADLDSIDPISGEYYPWSGANEKGLGLVQTSIHTLKDEVLIAHGYTPDSDSVGIDNGQLNMLILSRCETIDEVEELLRATNDGGGWTVTSPADDNCTDSVDKNECLDKQLQDGLDETEATARFTTSNVMVFDRYGNMATFEVGPADFTRDNVTSEYQQDPSGYYSAFHNDDKDLTNPPNGFYNGYDWRANFSRVNYQSTGGYPFFVDEHITEVQNDVVVNYGSTPDGIHDWETSSSAVKRWHKIGLRMDDPILKDYKYMIQKQVGSYGIPDTHDIESLARYIGDLPDSNGVRSTGYHVNRFATTFSVVITGSKIGDPHEGRTTTIWLAQGEPAMSVFIPIFAAVGPPTILNNMYESTNDKRHLVYDYTDDDSTGYSSGRNIDHEIDVRVLTGSNGNASLYYGEGGLQLPIFQSEYWAYDKYDEFMEYLRTYPNAENYLDFRMQNKHYYFACYMKYAYRRGISVPDVLNGPLSIACPAIPVPY